MLVSNEKKFIFLSKRFPATISHDIPLRAHGFLMRGEREMLLCDCSFSGYFNNYNVLNIYIMQKNNSTNIYLYPVKCGVRSSRFWCLLFKGS